MVGGIVNALSTPAVVSAASGGRGIAATEPAPFSGVLQAMLEQTSSLDEKAAAAVTGLMNGNGVEIHDAMIATEKADMAFELALQVRNKAVGAYQQMMNMQF